MTGERHAEIPVFQNSGMAPAQHAAYRAGRRRFRVLRAVQQQSRACPGVALQLQRGKRVPRAQHRASVSSHPAMEFHCQGLRQTGSAIPSGQSGRSMAVLRRRFRAAEHSRNGAADSPYAIHPLSRPFKGLQGQRNISDGNRTRPHSSGHFRTSGQSYQLLVRTHAFRPRLQP